MDGGGGEGIQHSPPLSLSRARALLLLSPLFCSRITITPRSAPPRSRRALLSSLSHTQQNAPSAKTGFRFFLFVSCALSSSALIFHIGVDAAKQTTTAIHTPFPISHPLRERAIENQKHHLHPYKQTHPTPARFFLYFFASCRPPVAFSRPPQWRARKR